jgi:hypothetical protein
LFVCFILSFDISIAPIIFVECFDFIFLGKKILKNKEFFIGYIFLKYFSQNGKNSPQKNH